jgi:thioredoxin 1
MSENTKAVTDQTFATDVLKASGPVLVDFWAEWCGPCKAIGPALEEIAGELKGKLTVAKVNIDDNPLTPNNYAVRGIPTLILFKDGKPAATQVGALPKSRLKEWITSTL